MIQDDSLTLGEAIAHMRRDEDPTGEVTAGMSAETAAAFDMHDAVHILFGCGTSLEGEIAAHVWMKFGTTTRIFEMHRAFAQQEHRKVLAGIGHTRVVGTWFRMLPRLIRIFVKARGMKKRIVFEELSHLKSLTIEGIRHEYGIVQ